MRKRLPTVILLVASFLALTSGNSNVMGDSSSSGGPPPPPPSHSSVSVGHSGVYGPPPSVWLLLIHVHVIVRVTVSDKITQTIPVLHFVTHTIQPKPASPLNGVTTIEVGYAATNNLWFYGFIGVGGSDLTFLALLIIMSILSARRSRQGDLSQSHQP